MDDGNGIKKNKDCIIAITGQTHKGNSKVLRIMRQFIDDYKRSMYDRNTGTGLIRHIVLKKGFRAGEVMFGIVINGDDMPHSIELVKALRKNIPEIKTIILNINKKKPNTIKGLKNKIIYGNGNFLYVKNIATIRIPDKKISR